MLCGGWAHLGVKTSCRRRSCRRRSSCRSRLQEEEGERLEKRSRVGGSSRFGGCIQIPPAPPGTHRRRTAPSSCPRSCPPSWGRNWTTGCCNCRSRCSSPRRQSCCLGRGGEKKRETGSVWGRERHSGGFNGEPRGTLWLGGGLNGEPRGQQGVLTGSLEALGCLWGG